MSSNELELFLMADLDPSGPASFNRGGFTERKGNED